MGGLRQIFTAATTSITILQTREITNMKSAPLSWPELGSDLQMLRYSQPKRAPIDFRWHSHLTHNCSAAHGCFAFWPKSFPKVITNDPCMPVQKRMSDSIAKLGWIRFSNLCHKFTSCRCSHQWKMRLTAKSTKASFCTLTPAN